MAAGIMVRPGSKFLCAGECAHRDCAMLRRELALPCSICKKLIEPGDRYYIKVIANGQTKNQVHALCQETQK